MPTGHRLDAIMTKARLRTFPGSLGKRGDQGSQIERAAQQRCVQVALHQANATGAVMPAWRERLLLGAAVAVLRQSGRGRGSLPLDAASSRPPYLSPAREPSAVHERPRFSHPASARRGKRGVR
jgi:hypothetical protein